MAVEIGTSMSRRRARRARRALAKKGCAAKAVAGSAMAAEIQCMRSRVEPSAPDQTETEKSITFIEAKPATAMRARRSRPSASTRVASRAALSRGGPRSPGVEGGDQAGLEAGASSAVTEARFERQVDAGGGDAGLGVERALDAGDAGGAVDRAAARARRAGARRARAARGRRRRLGRGGAGGAGGEGGVGHRPGRLYRRAAKAKGIPAAAAIGRVGSEGLPGAGLARGDDGVADAAWSRAHRGRSAPAGLPVSRRGDEVGHGVHEGVLVADDEAGHPPFAEVGVLAVGDEDRGPAAQRALGAVVEPGERG